VYAGYIAVGVLSVWIGSSPPAMSEPGYGPPLNASTGTIYRVGTVATLNQAFDDVNTMGNPATILVSNGVYVLNSWALPITCDHVIVRGESGDRDAVTIRGPDEGPSAAVEHVFWVRGSDVTIADMTFGWCRYHGVQAHGQAPYDVSGLRVHNCRLVNCNEQFIKGTSAEGDPEGVTDSIVEYSLFEFTNGWAYQYYTGGIDVHKAVNWEVHDNLFRNIRTPSGESGNAEHAVHFWKRCTTRQQDIRVERNIVINCDRGIGFGLGSWEDGHDGGQSVIRNNFVYNSGDGAWTDVGIGLEGANNVLVDNNTVYVPYWAPIEYRFTAATNLVFRNNLANGAITARNGAPTAARSNNNESAQASWFKDTAAGDLHLLPGTASALDQGCVVPGMSVDIDGESRPIAAGWDIGADEYDTWHADSDDDDMPDGWEIRYGLNPTNAADADADTDHDSFTSLDEWIADTNPTNAASFFSVADIHVSNRATIVFACSTARVYGLEFRASLITGTWSEVTGQTNIPGQDSGVMTLSQTGILIRAMYRIGVSITH